MSEHLYPVSGKMDLRDRVAIVTGAARGIGQAIALALAREGADVVIADVIPAEETAAGVRARGRRALVVPTDVSKAADVERLVDATVGEFGRVDILVNNAGTVQRVSLEDLTEELWDRDLDVILRGAYLCTRAVYPHMKRQRYGKIVNVSSVSGKIGGAVSKAEGAAEPGKGRSGAAYAAAKGGVIAFTRWVAKDAARSGIWVNCVCPGPVRTELARGFDYGVEANPIPRMGEPEDVAEAVVFLASNAANFICGVALNVDGGQVMD
ncbi:MAG: SDR family oxidoreductase [Chloroflexi bacterium]|nr:SDR family oxidoreductase [Chloroflexota bacterium]